MVKMRKKIISFLMALALAACVCCSFADSAGTADENVLILKELRIYNTAGEDIFLPKVSYTYTVAGVQMADSGNTVTDSAGTGSRVYSGVDEALTASSYTVEFSPDLTLLYDRDGSLKTAAQPLKADRDGTSWYGGFTVGINASAFEHPGIYRYMITEASAGRAAAGTDALNAGMYSSERYLDIYVRRAGGTDDAVRTAAGHVVYGYVLFEKDRDEAQERITANGVGNNTVKTSGFTGETGADRYNTFNLTISKTVRGDLADTTNDFPVEAVLTNSELPGLAAQIGWRKNSGEMKRASFENGRLVLGVLTDRNAEFSIRDRDTLTVVGLPAGTTASVREYNNTFDVYESETTVQAMTAAEPRISLMQSKTASAAVENVDNATTVQTPGTANSAVQFVNELKVISPTGYVVRILPFMLIAGFGVLLLIFFFHRKRKEGEQSDEI